MRIFSSDEILVLALIHYTNKPIIGTYLFGRITASLGITNLTEVFSGLSKKGILEDSGSNKELSYNVNKEQLFRALKVIGEVKPYLLTLRKNNPESALLIELIKFYD